MLMLLAVPDAGNNKTDARHASVFLKVLVLIHFILASVALFPIITDAYAL